jgi:hypothetical protein
MLSDLKDVHSRFTAIAGGLSDASSTKSSVHRVFDALDADDSKFIDRKELAQGVLHFLPEGDPDLLDTVWAEERIDDDAQLDYAQFEKFLVRFLQHRFYSCIESYVTNRSAFIKLGGRDLQGLVKVGALLL